MTKERLLIVSCCLLASADTRAQAIPDAVRHSAIAPRDIAIQDSAAYVTAAYVAANIEQDFGRLPVDTKPSSTCAAEDD